MKVAVIGAGIIGLCLARRISEIFPSYTIHLVDRFSIPSSGPSLRNSGVLHAGLYYQPNIKSRFCRMVRKIMTS